MTPEEAARAATELGCSQILQTHADATYTDPIARHLLSESAADPVAGLERALARQTPPAVAAAPGPAAAPAARFQPLRVGETRALLSGTSTTL
jgi:hypothetical protein